MISRQEQFLTLAIKGAFTTLMLSYMDLYVGCRVRLTRNSCTERGLYNGRTGTVMDLVYEREQLSDESTKEIPRIFSTLDRLEVRFR